MSQFCSVTGRASIDRLYTFSMRIAIIGAGAGGLAAARHTLASPGFHVTVFEQSDRLGGTWVYSDRVGNDDFGLPVNSSMYHNLITNGPKEVLGYPDVPFDAALNSYLKSTDILQYLEQFADRFRIREHIKLRHQVLSVSPIGDSTRWSLVVRDLLAAETSTHEYDAVIVGNGHYSVPAYPEQLRGRERFAGQQLHSHDYRRAEAFADKRVLVMGSGPSGVDIAWSVRNVARTMRLSSRDASGTYKLARTFGDEAMRPDVAELTATGARFADGSEEEFDAIIYCTGYLYRFPFLSAECGVQTDDNHVRPLFKQCVHMERPTLFFVGLTSFDLPFIGMDTQSRFVAALLRGEWRLPERAEMERVNAADLERCWAHGYNRRQAHKISDFVMTYFNELTELAHLRPVRPVFGKIFNHGLEVMFNDWARFRLVNYTVVDDETFEFCFLDEKQ